ncbi:MAG: branched-chain amino acid ABC transporter permease [Actinomycetota bacterium]
MPAVRERIDRWAARTPRPVRALGALAGPAAVFGFLVGAIRLEDPLMFALFCSSGGVLVWLLRRSGVLGVLRAFGDEHRVLTIVAGASAMLAFPLTQLQSAVWIRVAVLGAVYAALALGLNIVVGRTGLLDLGYAAFFGIGAYAAAMTSSCTGCPIAFPMPWLASLLASAVIGALFGVLLGFPVLRLRGDYLAVVTLGFGEIVRVALNNLDHVPLAGINLTNGPNGLFGVGQPRLGPVDLGTPFSLFGLELPSILKYYYVALLLTLLIVLVVRRLDRSRIGRAWTAIREDELAARAMGINTTTTKLLAFASGAFFGGIAGNVFVHFQTGTSPADFSFDLSILVLAMVVLGGMGNVAGVVVGSVLLVALPEKLRFVEEFRYLFLGLSLMLMMRFRPEGLLPEKRRQRELATQAGGPDVVVPVET